MVKLKINEDGMYFLYSKGLTDTERLITSLIYNFTTNREIGQAINIGESSVKQHLSNVYKKLKIPNKINLMFHLKDYVVEGEPLFTRINKDNKELHKSKISKMNNYAESKHKDDAKGLYLPKGLKNEKLG